MHKLKLEISLETLLLVEVSVFWKNSERKLNYFTSIYTSVYISSMYVIESTRSTIPFLR